jgi:hypothetical protein
MAVKITFGCNRCGAQIVTRDAAEALAWDKSHDAVCVALITPEVTR